MARYRVGEGGLRVITARGTYSLPPGVVLDELPERYNGTLVVLNLDNLPTADPSVAPPVDGASAGAFYEDRMLRPANSGHGHVRPRPDGVKARCGGPAICPECRRELIKRRQKLGRQQ